MSLQAQEDIVKYLDAEGHLAEIAAAALNYKNKFVQWNKRRKSSPPMKYILKLDFLILADLSAEVAELLLSEPHLAHNLFHYIVHNAVVTLGAFAHLCLSQVHLLLRIHSLPLFPHLVISSGHHLPQAVGLFILRGILIAKTTTMKYLQSTVYSCQCGRVQRMSMQPTTPVCSSCGLLQKELYQGRNTGDQVLATIIDAAAFQSPLSGHACYQGVTVCFKDDLSAGLQLGVLYDVVVSREGGARFTAWSVVAPGAEPHMRTERLLRLTPVPNSIHKLMLQLSEIQPLSPWTLVFSLSSQIAAHVYPHNTFLNLKAGILLSLASQYVGTAPTTANLWGLPGGRGQVDELQTCWLEAGPLTLARGGVCYLGDWDKFGRARNAFTSHIISSLESEQVSISMQGTAAALGPPPSALTLPLSCSVWTYWNFRDYARLKTLINVFGLPFLGDGGTDDEAMSDVLLANAMGITMQTQIDAVPMQDIKQYLELVSSQIVTVDLLASQLIRNYFVASRRERPDCLPVIAIKNMTSLAEAHARLTMRNSVTYEDVVAVVYLYEEVITALFGQSLLSAPPLRTLVASQATKALSIAHQMDSVLPKFSLWLDNYIKTLINDSSQHLPREE